MPHTTHKTERKAYVESTATTRPEQELFNESDLEARYRLKKSWQRKARRIGQLPYLKIGGRLVRYKKSDIENFLRQCAR